MPTPETRLYKPEKLNRWFAVCSVLMTISFAWMITIDYDRAWRDHQKEFFLSKAALAHLDYLVATRDERLEEIAQAEQRLADAEELIATTRASEKQELEDRIVEAQLEFTLANGEWSRKDQTLLVLRDTYEKVLNEHGPDHERTQAVHEKLLEDEKEVEELRKVKEQWEDDRARLKSELDELNSGVRSARKKLVDLQTAANDALKKDQNLRGVLSDPPLKILEDVPVVSSLINFPILDFAAPKTTPGRQQVKQLVLPDVRQRLNYLESYTTDRCTTCHVAIDDPEFSKDRLASKLERSLVGINDALRRDGKDPLNLSMPPIVGIDGKELPEGEVTEHWDNVSREDQNEYFDSLLELVNTYLEQSDRKTIDLGHPLLAHPDLDLFISVDSAHPMAKMGCTVCHEGNPQETDFVLASHSPSTHKVREDWKEKYYIRRFGVPNTTFETVEHYWDRPMLLPQYTQAGCTKCHSQISDIAEYRGDPQGELINHGRHLFASVGCINCHDDKGIPNARRVGPDLANVGTKLQPGFVQKWAYFPQDFRPSTRMPHFFMQENNGEGSETPADATPVERTKTEVLAMSEYLFALSNQDWQPLTPPEGVQGDVERGRELFKSTGCLACHGNITEFGEDWIASDLVQREGLDEETAKYRYLGMTDNERVRYAMEHFPSDVDTFLDPESARYDSGKEYNTPVFTRFAPELSGMGSKTTFEWLYSWLIEPTHYSPDTKMPNMRLTESEAADIATYLLSLRNDEFDQEAFELTPERRALVDELIFTLLTAQRSERQSRDILNDKNNELSNILVEILKSTMDGRDNARQLLEPMPLEQKKLLYLGNKMISHYGCYTCHNIAGFESTAPVGTELTLWAEKPVTQLDFANYDHAFHHLRHEKPEIYGLVYPPDADQLNALSPIDNEAGEEIAQTHAGFAKHKLLNPRIWDREKLKASYDKLKMPNFYFTEKEAEALTTYLLSRIPPRVTDNLQVDYETGNRGPIAEGRNLMRELNCIACHEIDGNAPTIQQYFTRMINGREEFDSINAPPSLVGEGAKVQHDWFHRFLQQVEPLRPWLQVRMPSFTLTGEQATVLAEYFAALSKTDAEMLVETRAPIQEFQNDASSRPELDAEDWFNQDYLKPRAQDLRRFAIERKLMRTNDLDLLTLSEDRLRSAHAGLLDRVDFMSALYDVAYPFVEPPRQLETQEQFQKGFAFFKDMGCLQCHILGDMLPGPASNTDDFVNMYRLDGVRGEGDSAVAVINGEYYPVGSEIDGHKLISAENKFYESGDVETKAIFEGPNAAGETEKIQLQAPSAPNLSLTYQRLRRTWVYKWMLEPGWMQPGTKMPQNFVGGVSPFEGDPSYPGTSEDHINILVDFLYQAGATSARAPVEKTVIADTSEEFDEEGGFDDEEFDD